MPSWHQKYPSGAPGTTVDLGKSHAVTPAPRGPGQVAWIPGAARGGRTIRPGLHLLSKEGKVALVVALLEDRMRILVIGGTGFIGQFLLPELLRAGHDVAVVHRAESAARLPDGARSIPA